jgi:hypothetical protein
MPGMLSQELNHVTKRWSIEVYLYRHRERNFELIENYCYTLDYDKHYPVPDE